MLIITYVMLVAVLLQIVIGMLLIAIAEADFVLKNVVKKMVPIIAASVVWK